MTLKRVSGVNFQHPNKKGRQYKEDDFWNDRVTDLVTSNKMFLVHQHSKGPHVDLSSIVGTVQDILLNDHDIMYIRIHFFNDVPLSKAAQNIIVEGRVTPVGFGYINNAPAIDDYRLMHFTLAPSESACGQMVKSIGSNP